MPEWTKNWFSNMLPFDEPVVHEGITYLAPENFYQAQKFSEPGLKEFIASLSPWKAKTEARKHKSQIRSDWNDAERIKWMRHVIDLKFTAESSWGKKLLDTGDEEIIEWNNWGDDFFGKIIETQEGKNHLGNILMQRRNGLRLWIMLDGFEHPMHKI